MARLEDIVDDGLSVRMVEEERIHEHGVEADAAQGVFVVLRNVVAVRGEQDALGAEGQQKAVVASYNFV